MYSLTLDRLDPNESIASITISMDESIGRLMLLIIFRNSIYVPRSLEESDEHLLMPHFRRYFPEATRVIYQADPRHYHHRPNEVTLAHLHIDLGLNRRPTYEETCNIIRAIRAGSQQLEEVHPLGRLFTPLFTPRTFLTQDAAIRLSREIKAILTRYGQEQFLYYASSEGTQTTVSVSRSRPFPPLNVPTLHEMEQQERNFERNLLLGTALLGILMAFLLERCCCKNKRFRKKKTNTAAPAGQSDTPSRDRRDHDDHEDGTTLRLR